MAFISRFIRKTASVIALAVMLSVLGAAPVMACGCGHSGQDHASTKTDHSKVDHKKDHEQKEDEDDHDSSKQSKDHDKDHAKKVETEGGSTKTVTSGGVSSPSGDNGTVKIHRSGTSDDEEANQPKVCSFYLDAFNFDASQVAHWNIVSGTHGQSVLSGNITLGSDGHGRTADYRLPNGMYKLDWNFNGEHGNGKHKVFKVECGETLAANTQVTPTKTVSSNQGQVLGASTTAAVGSLANTGSSARVATILALGTVAAAFAVKFAGRRKLTAPTDVPQYEIYVG